MFFSRILIIASVLVLFQLHLLRADGTTTSTTVDEDDYDEEVYDSKENTDIVDNIVEHWKNCTFNHVVYYDYECDEWMRNFYIALSLTALGLLLFLLMAVYCGRKYCCSRPAPDFERLIENHYT